jgi:hypothetical protein
MATDGIVYLTLGPYGLLLAFVTLGGALVIWRGLLGETFAESGLLPLAVAYASALAGLLALSFAFSYLQFSDLVARGLFSESQRWSVMPGRLLYAVLLHLWIVLPGLTLVCVPLAAMLIRRRRLGFLAVGMIALGLWVAPSVALYAVAEKTEWERTHFFEQAAAVLAGMLPAILLVPLPFFLSLSLLAGRQQAEVGTR